MTSPSQFATDRRPTISRPTSVTLAAGLQVVILGSLLVIALLAAPTARAYFRRGRAVGAAIAGGPSLSS